VTKQSLFSGGEVMIGIPIGLMYANAVEAMFHRYVLHGLGKDPTSFWAFHWNEHHREARRTGFHDRHYRTRGFFGWHSQNKERLATALGVLVHLPLAPVAPFFVATVAACGVWFVLLHRKAHLDPAWAREHVPWHFDHHMGPDQDQNWGIALDWYDRLAGTRLRYVGTEREASDLARRAARTAAAR
jgi:sterol desaturase/sphingolipid hydroxylase (fatty acid hydroxylase superfamily)